MNFIRKIGSKLYFILFATAILMAISARDGKFFGYTFSQIFNKDKDAKADIISIDEARQFFPNATSLKKLNEDELEILDVNAKTIGWLLQTMPSCSDIRGYGGPVPLIICIDSSKKVSGISMLENSETASFADSVKNSDNIKQWIGKTTSEAVKLEVDAVSGATRTSDAVFQSVKRRIAIFENLEQERQKLSFYQVLIEVIAWVYLVIAVLAFFPKTNLAKYRVYILFASIIFPGFLLTRFVSTSLIYNWAKNGIPFGTQFYMVILVFLAIIFPIFTGKGFYCVWYCPFGASQELIGKLCSKKLKISGGFGQFLKKLRPVILILLVFLLIIGTEVSLDDLEPFSAFIIKSASYIAIGIAGIMLLLSLFVAKPWCNYFCPTGQVLECARQTSVTVEQIKNIEILKGDDKMKFSEVLNLLLVVIIIVLLMGPQKTQFVNKQEHRKSINNAEVAGQSQQKNDQKIEQTKEEIMKAVSEVKTEIVKSVNEAKEEIVKNPTITKISNEEIDINQIVLQNIFSRKSVRHYTEQSVEKEKLEMLVKAAMAAPSAVNRQPWQFIILNDVESAKSLCNALPHAKYNAPAAIVVCGDTTIDTQQSFWIQDCSAATQNLLLAAESMGLGAVWTAVTPSEDRVAIVKEMLNLPENIIPLNVVCIGYSTGEDKPKDKWKPERIHWNRY